MTKIGFWASRSPFWRFDVKELIDKLKINNEVLIFPSNIGYDGIIQKLDNIDVIVIFSDGINSILEINKNAPNFLREKKIIVIRDISSWDTIHIGNSQMASMYIKNIYIPLGKMHFNHNNTKILLKDNRPYMHELFSIGNVEQMPLYQCSKNPFLSKDDFFKKYNLDINKEIFTIFLTFPKLYTFKNISRHTETIMLYDTKLMHNIVTILQKKYNVVFKPHPFFGMTFEPFSDGGYFYNKNKWRFDIPLTFMKDNYIDKYKFIEFADHHDVNIYTKIGMLMCNSTFGFHNYQFDIPLLHVINEKKGIEHIDCTNFPTWLINDPLDRKAIEDIPDMSQVEEVEDKTWDIWKENCCIAKKLYYGSFTTIESINTDTEKVLNDFIEKHSNSTFKYKHNHPLYGDSYELNVDTWCNYINRVIDKPIK